MFPIICWMAPNAYKEITGKQVGIVSLWKNVKHSVQASIPYWGPQVLEPDHLLSNLILCLLPTQWALTQHCLLLGACNPSLSTARQLESQLKKGRWFLTAQGFHEFPCLWPEAGHYRQELAKAINRTLWLLSLWQAYPNVHLISQ